MLISKLLFATSFLLFGVSLSWSYAIRLPNRSLIPKPIVLAEKNSSKFLAGKNSSVGLLQHRHFLTAGETMEVGVCTFTPLQGDLKREGWEVKMAQFAYKSKQKKTKMLMVDRPEGSRAAKAAGVIDDKELTRQLAQFKVNAKHGDYNLISIDLDLLACKNEKEAKDYIGKNAPHLLEMMPDSSNDNRPLLLEHLMKSDLKQWPFDGKITKKIEFTKKWDWAKEKGPAMGTGSLTVKVSAEATLDVKLILFYEVEYVWGWPVSVKTKKISAQATLAVTGEASLDGEAKATITGYTNDALSKRPPTLTSGVFVVGGVIPVQYDVVIPISAGTGDLTVKASGHVDVKKTIKLNSDFKYICRLGSCEAAPTYTPRFDDEAGKLPNPSREIKASLSIEPWFQVDMKPRFYWGAIWASVGVKPTISIVLDAYGGNMCGDGDGDGTLEQVNSKLLDINFHIYVVLAVGSNFISSFFSKTFDVWQKNLFATDLGIGGKSTALSPIIRFHNKGGNAVGGNIDLRPCVEHYSQQSFSVDWGDSGTDDVKDVPTEGKDISHKYSKPGTYTVVVKHDNGAATTAKITVGTAADAPAPEASCIEQDKKYSPLDMPGQDKTIEISAFACSKRCEECQGCAHYSYWTKEGTCHIHDARAVLVGAKLGVIAGTPKSCSPCKTEKDKFYAKDMPGQKRTHAISSFACQMRCAAAKGCAKFSYFPDHGCHLHLDSERPAGKRGVIIGRANC